MDKRFKEIQDRYIAELRQMAPSILIWWEASQKTDRAATANSASGLTFEQRWPSGLAAHPRIIDVFRKYFLEVSDLNDELEDERYEARERRVEGEAAWGIDDADDAIPFEKPIDLLVNDLEANAPDLFEIMQGMVFVPIGMDPSEELS